MQLIQCHVDPGAEMLVVPDGQATYSGLSAAGYKHSFVIHKHEFKNNQGYTTNSAVSIWAQFKGRVNQMHGLRKDNYEEYMEEFMYCYIFAKGAATIT